MNFLSVAFTSPWMLAALALLPAIWWLLRLTPPRPQEEVFPPLRILASVLKREETPSKSPWWLTLLRMLLIAAVIFALSQPVLNPRQAIVSGQGTLAVMVDNGWSSEPDWDTRVATLREILSDASANERPVSLVFSADITHNAAPTTADVQLERLNAAKVQPVQTDRLAATAALQEALKDQSIADLVLISDGLSTEGDNEALSQLSTIGAQRTIIMQGDGAKTLAISSSRNEQNGLTVVLSRLSTGQALTLNVDAQDSKSRILSSGVVSFAPDATEATTTLNAPVELRNDFAKLSVRESQTAGATRLLDDSAQRRRVAILASDSGTETNSLLQQESYINKAISPYADIITIPQQDVAGAIRTVLEQNPSVIFMADIGRLPPESQSAIQDWINEGGSLVRFAGPRLASATSDDPLLPVRLRQGERSFGGALTWAEPQELAEFPVSGPFSSLAHDPEIKIKRQILAEPSPELAERTWASLDDGTPLVTASEVGLGRIVLFHVSAEPSWSDLPLSGQFVEMLRQVMQTSNALSRGNAGSGEPAILAPFRLLTSSGALTTEIAAAKPYELTPTSLTIAMKSNPPGLYGSDDGYVALNLFDGAALSPLNISALGNQTQLMPLVDSQSIALLPALLLFALALLVIDTLATLIINGAGASLRRKPAAGAALSLALAIGGLTFIAPDHASAADSKAGDEALMDGLDTTRLAYVVTGESDVDQLSEQGLRGLGDFIRYRTTFDAGPPAGVNLQSDELSFYPIIYWPISATAPMPSPEAVARIDAYMRAGGTVLFDTRDQTSSFGATNSPSPNSQRLQEILASVDIPPLEQTPENHVLTRSFYLLKDFPGRHTGGALWIESRQDASRSVNAVTAAGDGVTPIIITSNDFAGAWAIDESGAPVLPTVPSDPMQRNYAYRAGLNIMMYMLTGNYKADQVHVPALLERLGQ
jgi:hypothetical protein